MTVINTNVSAVTARAYTLNSSYSIEKNIGKLSSGKRVNSGADDAAGLAVANKMEAQLRSTTMAIQNASNGISLIQTAGSGMSKVNSMLIRIREAAVQMANGVYTDLDRANAQAEVKLLKEEIDKISENLQFNQVYVLDGSYQQSFRTGVSNDEVFGLSIISQRAEELGKEAGPNVFGTTINAATHANSLERVNVSAVSASSISIDTTQLGSEFQAFLVNNPAPTFELSGEDSALFTISSTGKIETSQITHDPQFPAHNLYQFSVTAVSGQQQFTNDINLNIEENTTAHIVRKSTTLLSSTESAALSFRAVNSSNASDGVLSIALQDFVDADAGAGTFSIAGGDDAAVFNIDAASGVVSASIDYEDTADSNGDDIYNMVVKYTSAAGDEFTETVNLTITDGQEETVEYVMLSNPLPAIPFRSRFSLDIDNQTLSTATFDPGVPTFSEIANRLNMANKALSSPARANFNASTNGIEAVFENEAGNVSNVLTSSAVTVEFEVASTVGGPNFVETQTAAEAAAYAKTYDSLYGALNQAQSGDIFTYDYDGSTLSVTVGPGHNQGTYSVADLADDLNRVNSERPVPLAVTFTTSEDTLTATRTITGPTIPPTTFGDLTFNGTALSSSGPSVTAQAAQDRQVTLNTSSWIFSASGDIPELTIDGEKIIGAPLPGLNPGVVEVANSLNAALSARGISVSASFTPPTSSLTFTTSGLSVSAANALDFEKLEIWQPGITASVGFNRTEALSEVSFAGAASIAAAGRDNSANGNNTDGTATNQLIRHNANLTAAHLVGAHSIIHFEDDLTFSLGVDDLSQQLRDFIDANPFGSFSLDGVNANDFKIDAFDGTLKTTAAFKAAPSSIYSIAVHYESKDGQSFTNQITLIRDPLQNVVKDSVADINISTVAGATEAITILDRAINQMAAQEATMGAAQNRLEHAIDYLSMAGLNTEASKGRIVDADFATVSSNLAKQQILNQASSSMLAQANQSKQMLLSLLR